MQYKYAEAEFIEAEWCTDTIDVEWRIRGVNFKIPRMEMTSNRLGLTNGYISLEPQEIYPVE